MLQKTPLSFDVVGLGVLRAAVRGGRLVVARPAGHRDPALAGARWSAGQRVTTLQVVPSLLRVFLEEPGVAGLRGPARWR